VPLNDALAWRRDNGAHREIPREKGMGKTSDEGEAEVKRTRGQSPSPGVRAANKEVKTLQVT